MRVVKSSEPLFAAGVVDEAAGFVVVSAGFVVVTGFVVIGQNVPFVTLRWTISVDMMHLRRLP